MTPTIVESAPVDGVGIPAEERTPLVEALLGVIEGLQETNEQLRETIARQQRRIEGLEEEVQRLKGLPEQPKRTPQPGGLQRSRPPSASGGKRPKRRRGQRPGSGPTRQDL